MKYLMFVCADAEPDTDKENEPDIDVRVADNDANGRRLQGMVLAPKSSATTVRVRAVGHATARDAAGTDWAAIAGYYDELAAQQPSPVVDLNRAVAHGFAHGPKAGLVSLAKARKGGALDD